MARVIRIDKGTLGDIERTPQGGLKIPAFLTRTGVFEYTNDDGSTVREYRPPEEVFRDDSMAMLRGAPIAVDHPPEPIQPNNFRAFAVGHVADDVRKDTNKVGATLYVQDEAAIKAVEAGRRELSCGYHCDVDEIPGVTPSGEPYDRVQRNIQYNHLALVANGRAGHDVRLRLDSTGNQKGDTMMEKIELVDGIEYAVGSDAHRAARERHDSADKERSDSLSKLKADHDKACARADAAEAELAKLTTDLKEKLSPERLDAAVRNRTALIEKAHRIIGKDYKTDGVHNSAIRLAIVASAFPELSLEGKSADYVKGLYQAASHRADSKSKPLPPELKVPPTPGTGARTLDQIRRDARDEQAQRASQPLAISKDRQSQAKG